LLRQESEERRLELAKQDGNAQKREAFEHIMRQKVNELNVQRIAPIIVSVQPFGKYTTKGLRLSFMYETGGEFYTMTYTAPKMKQFKARQLVNGPYGHLVDMIRKGEVNDGEEYRKKTKGGKKESSKKAAPKKPARKKAAKKKAAKKKVAKKKVGKKRKSAKKRN
jgi:hypothetical protein